MMELKVDKKSRRVTAEMNGMDERQRLRIKQALHDIGEDVKKETKRLIETGSKTGRVYGFNGGLHQASAPGEAPANMTGKLAKSVNYRVRNQQEMAIGEKEHYAIYLEDGTRKMAPRPHLDRKSVV